ncbi:MAG: beta-lactamase family protein [Gammaproteobacteria bacterium]|nr:beta-lactamase family protein [Gammaproteobacteria bacterium]
MKNKIKLAVVVSLIVSVFSNTALATVDNLEYNLNVTLDKFFDRLVIPGLSVAVIVENGDEVTAQRGTTLDNEELTEDHVFRLASMSKHLTTLMVMYLHEIGELNIDDKLSDYLVIDGLENGDVMTIRQLLNHTAGVFDHINGSPNVFSAALGDPEREWEHEDIIKYMTDNGSYFTPGSQYSYSNGGFYILGMLIEAITGESLAQSFDSIFLNPLALSNIFVDDFSTANNPITNLATNSRSYEYHLNAIGAAGNFVASPLAFARLGHEVYTNDFLTDESEMAISTQSTLNSAYGLGSRLWEAHDVYHFGHTGKLGGYRGIFMYIPEQKTSIVISASGYPATSSTWWLLIDTILLDAIKYNQDPSYVNKPPEPVDDEKDDGEEEDNSSGGGSFGFALISMLALIAITRRTLKA